MAITLNGTSQYLMWTGTNPIASYPWSIFMWVKFAHLTDTHILGGYGQDGSSGSDGESTIQADAAGTGKVGAMSRVGGGNSFAASVDSAVTTWQPVLAVFTANSGTGARKSYYGASSSAGTDAGSITIIPANFTKILIGRRTQDTAAMLAGDVAEFAIWDADMSSHWATLQGGALPESVNGGANLIEHWSLETAGSYAGTVSRTLTATGTPTQAATHPIARGALTLPSAQGSYSLTGQSAGLLFNRKLTAEYGTHSLTGQDVGLLLNRLVSAAQGSYALTGQDATLTYTQPGVYSLTADSGTYNWTVSDAFADYTMVALHGTYDLTGQDATLTLTGAPPQDYVMSVDAGYYSLTGRAAALRWSGAPIVPSSGKGLSLSMRIGL